MVQIYHLQMQITVVSHQLLFPRITDGITLRFTFAVQPLNLRVASLHTAQTCHIPSRSTNKYRWTAASLTPAISNRCFIVSWIWQSMYRAKTRRVILSFRSRISSVACSTVVGWTPPELFTRSRFHAWCISMHFTAAIRPSVQCQNELFGNRILST